MKITKCDRCGNENEDDQSIGWAKLAKCVFGPVYGELQPVKNIDLCATCSADFDLWLKLTMTESE